MDIEWVEPPKQTGSTGKQVRPGIHTVVVASVDEGKSKAGHDQLTIRLRVQGGPDSGLHVTDWFHIMHPTHSIKERSLAKLCQLAAAVGINRKFNISELVGKRCQATVYLDQGSNNYDPAARVRSFSAAETNDDMEAADLPF